MRHWCGVRFAPLDLARLERGTSLTLLGCQCQLCSTLLGCFEILELHSAPQLPCAFTGVNSVPRARAPR
jgi:hypothetical protein